MIFFNIITSGYLLYGKYPYSYPMQGDNTETFWVTWFLRKSLNLEHSGAT